MAMSRRRLLSTGIQVTSAAAAATALGGTGTAHAAPASVAGAGAGQPTGLWAEFTATPYNHRR